jgi:hypothetical protein
MTIAEARDKCKSALGRIPRDVLILAILLLASSASFGLGYFAGRDAGQGSIIPLNESPTTASESGAATVGQVVASKNGTKYYLPDCAGADRISEANKVWFASAAAAAAAGYAPAANCKGL